ncbi:MAG: Ig domain-containing protein [Muribaculaceae bacterium]
MKTLKQKLQVIIMMTIFTLTFSTTASATSAKNGSASVYEGYTTTVSISAIYKSTLMMASSVSYYWYSENTSYVTVTSSNYYQATVKGIKATSTPCRVYFKCSYIIDGYFREMDFYYDITVNATNVSVTSISLSNSAISLTPGDTKQLSASVYPTNATNKNVTWSSSNTNVATVSSSGLVTAKAAGTAIITCRAADGSGASATCSITVTDPNISVTSITLSNSAISLTPGDTKQLSATVYPTNASNRVVTWSSSNTTVATVSSNGLVTAKTAGNAIIFCRSTDGSEITALCGVTVTSPEIKPTSISLNKSSAIIYEGESVTLTATILPEDATNQTVTWISDNSSVAKVTSSGAVTAISSGEANIVVTTTNNLAAVCKVTVKAQSSGVTTNWQGSYTVKSSHVVNEPTFDYIDNFNLTIEDIDGTPYITSMFGEDLTTYNNGGLKLHDNGDATATIDLSYYNILKYTDIQNPLYTIYIFDEDADDWTDYWTLTMNPDGTITLGEFYIAAFTWNEEREVWTNAQVEALYYNLTASPTSTDINTTQVQQDLIISTANGNLQLSQTTNIMVYNINGTLVFNGTTDCVEKLPQGIYIVKYGNKSEKIIIY